ncbi:hypothetical protein ABT340_15750 [Streptosporangium sp. NPDC000239]|uniref:hypothetical protein n=1 Tax=Streptosporangium sp. NPDC000239 TaxID=3154248 RepID=UPI00332E8CF7
MLVIVLSLVWFRGVAQLLRTESTLPIKRVAISLGMKPSLEIECYEVPDPPNRPESRAIEAEEKVQAEPAS